MFEYNLITENNEGLLQSRNKRNEKVVSKKEQIKFLLKNNSYIFFSLSLLGYLFMISGV